MLITQELIKDIKDIKREYEQSMDPNDIYAITKKYCGRVTHNAEYSRYDDIEVEIEGEY